MTMKEKEIKSVCLVFLLFLLTCPGHMSVGQDLSCNFCGRPIEGQYYKFENGYYHVECYNKHLAPRCDWCGRVIEGKYYSNDSGSYHTECFETHIATRCDLCGKILYGSYIVDSWGNKICAGHQKEILQCDYCQRFISDKTSDGARQYPDGRIVCMICYRDIIVETREARRIMEEVAEILAQYGLDIDYRDVPITLVDRDEICRRAQDLHADLNGFAYYEQSSVLGGLIKTNNFKIYLVDGMPRFYFTATMAHELMHLWLYANAPLEMEPALREGSCNYAAWLVMQHYRSDEYDILKQLQMNNNDPIYGEGLRKVKQFVDKNGMGTWLNYLRQHRENPW